MAPSDGFLIKKEDAATVAEMIRWFRQNRQLIPFIHRRNPRLGGGGGGQSFQFAKVIEMPKRWSPEDDTERAYYTIRDTGTSYSVWIPSSQYPKGTEVFFHEGDIVVYPTTDDSSYKALCDIEDDDRDTEPNSEDASELWEKCEEIKVEWALGFENAKDFDIRDCTPWIEKGEIIIYTSREIKNVGTIYYIMNPSMKYNGPLAGATEVYDEIDKCTYGVFS